MKIMQFVAVIAGRYDIDAESLLANMARTSGEAGNKVIGLQAERASDAVDVCSAGFLRDITSESRFSIAFESAPNGTRCHLDAKGFRAACEQLLPQIPEADLVLLSKFGKLEATEEGLWPAFAVAASAGTPILTTVSSQHSEAFKTAVPTATWLDAERVQLMQWWQSTKSH